MIVCMCVFGCERLCVSVCMHAMTSLCAVAECTQGPQPHLAEIKRLLRRKSELVASGAYSRDDPLIVRIEQRVMELAGAQ